MARSHITAHLANHLHHPLYQFRYAERFSVAGRPQFIYFSLFFSSLPPFHQGLVLFSFLDATLCLHLLSHFPLPRLSPFLSFCHGGRGCSRTCHLSFNKGTGESLKQSVHRPLLIVPKWHARLSVQWNFLFCAYFVLIFPALSHGWSSMLAT